MRTLLRRICLIALSAALCCTADAAARKHKRQWHHTPDTLVTAPASPQTEIRPGHRMLCSAFPVQISVTGRAVQIKSEHSQMLPIYTRSGILYMTMRLNKGSNWMSGLPRGHYFINNRPITIN